MENGLVDGQLVVAAADGTEVSDRVVVEVAEAIRAMHRVHGLRLVVDVGRLIVERIFSGDGEAIHRRGRKESALTRLANQPDFPFSLSQLSRAVGIYESVANLGEVENWRNLTLTHVRTVLPLPAPERQQLLAKAEQKGWSVKQLEVHAKKVRAGRSGGGRPPLSSTARTINAFLRASDEFRIALADVVTLDGLSPEQIATLTARAALVRNSCLELERRLEEPLVVVREFPERLSGEHR